MRPSGSGIFPGALCGGSGGSGRSIVSPGGKPSPRRAERYSGPDNLICNWFLLTDPWRWGTGRTGRNHLSGTRTRASVRCGTTRGDRWRPDRSCDPDATWRWLQRDPAGSRHCRGASRKRKGGECSCIPSRAQSSGTRGRTVACRDPSSRLGRHRTTRRECRGYTAQPGCDGDRRYHGSN